MMGATDIPVRFLMRARWPIAAFCLLALCALRTDAKYGAGGWGGEHGGNYGGGGNNYNPLNTPLTLENAIGEAVWTGGGDNSDQAPQVYKPLTKDDLATATEALRTTAKALDDKYHMHFKDTSSAHTLIYATAPDSALPALSSKAEQAYSLAIRAFGPQSKQVVLPGKLLIYILDRASLYQSFAKDSDNFEVPKGALGYTWFADDGSGAVHIVMGPPPDDLKNQNVSPIMAWQAALVRATTFALVDRFHSDHPIPNWVIQGLADSAADSVLPQPLNRTRAYLMSQQKDFSLYDVLKDKRDEFSAHPIMQTLTETLLLRDRASYVNFLLALKDAKPIDDALQSGYKWSFDQVAEAWGLYIKRFANKTQ
jgi:hypothetical protein